MNKKIKTRPVMLIIITTCIFIIYGQSFALDKSVAKIRADKVHALGYNGFNADVAIIDTGVGILSGGTDDDLNNHPDLTWGTTIYREDFSSSGTKDDTIGHGTHVAGIVASNDFDGTDAKYIGVAPYADILSGKHDGHYDQIVNAFEWALSHSFQPADVINYSFGESRQTSDGTYSQLQSYIDFIIDNPSRTANTISDSMNEPVTVVIAAGNGEDKWRKIGLNPSDASSPVYDPGSAYNAITVGVTTDEPDYDQLADWSSRRGEKDYGPDGKPGKGGVDDDGDGMIDETDEWAAPGSDDSVKDNVNLRSKPDIVAPGVNIQSTNNDWGPVENNSNPLHVASTRNEGDNNNNPGEPFTDNNSNGFRDPGEPFTDTNGNGSWDVLDDDSYDFVSMDGTSMAAPHVAGAAALLYDIGTKNNLTETGTPNDAELDHKVIKAVLLNATDKVGKDPSDPSVVKDRDGSVWSHTQTQPLDDGLGAGQLDAYNAYINYMASDLKGEENPSDITKEYVEPIAWDIQTIGKDGFTSHFYTIDEPLLVNSWLTSTLVWDKHVIWTDDGDGVVEYTDTFNYQPLDDLDLYLWRGTFDNLSFNVDWSWSDIDNLEHIHYQIAESDYYTLEVRLHSGDGENYGLAWWSTPVPEPSTYILVLIGLCGLLVWKHGRKKAQSRLFGSCR